MIIQQLSDGTFRRKQEDADSKEQKIKRLNSIEKALKDIILKTIKYEELSKYQSSLRSVRAKIAKDRDKLLGK
ncbi:MAG: hypothetical protein KAT14_07460 [Candidatus Marinimicrobia bacterium]|nr:hypothetical protein [Candidatus Neomarinimicrobiota bacterium]